MALVDAQTELYLEQWGIWSRMGSPEPKGARSWLGVMEERLVQQNRGPGLSMPDGDCSSFDSGVMLLVKRNWPDDYNALSLYYIDGMNSRSMAKALKVDKTSGLALLKVAIGRVDTLLKAG